MKAVLATLLSLFIPGSGHIFYGQIAWAVAWFVLGWMTCGVANLFSAGHIIYLASK